jgi:glutamate/tyrosine decarboxylase-like PLP-dependent enzyme
LKKGYFESKILKNIREEEDFNSLDTAKSLALKYIRGVGGRRVFPDNEAITGLDHFNEELGYNAESPENILKMLDKYGSPATVAQTGGRYFGFVNGGIIPAALNVKWLIDAWDQNAALYVISPVTSRIEEVCEGWIKELLRLPPETAAGFVGGSSTATLCGLTAGRNHLLNNLGYDVAKKGLFNAPEIKVVVGEQAHSTVFKALSIIGLGAERIIKVPSDPQGRMKADKIPELDNRTLLILQAGNVNSGSFDDFKHICPAAQKANAWIHVDGAFGLWALACDDMKPLTEGLEMADSWSADAHKTLNSPYDNGIILCRHRDALTGAMHMTGSYIIYSENRDGMLYTPEMSRRARGIEIWATLKALGKKGVSELVLELHDKAEYFAGLLRDSGLDILNDVVFNQVLVHHINDEKTEKLIKLVQQSGVCWMGGARWQGKSVMRISVSSYKTSYEDIEISAKEIIKIAKVINTTED